MESTARIAAPPAPITAALPFEKAKRTRSADPPFESNCSATTLSPHTAARKHAEERPADRRQQIKPEALQMEADNGWAKRARQVHRRAADRAGKQVVFVDENDIAIRDVSTSLNLTIQANNCSLFCE